MPPTPEQELGQLLAGVSRLHRTMADRSLDAIGLFRGQSMLLMVLSRHDGVTHSEAAEKLGISAAAVSKVVKRMERGGYVERRADPTDERLSRVYLREPGRALIARIDAAFAKLDSEMLAGFDGADRERLRDLLQRMRTNLSQFQP